MEEDIFEKDLSGAMVSPDEPGYDKLISAIFESMKLAYELNDGYHTPDEVRDYLSRITGRPIDESVTLLPPFYVDYGKNIRFGKRCWIQRRGAPSAIVGASLSATTSSSRRR